MTPFSWIPEAFQPYVAFVVLGLPLLAFLFHIRKHSRSDRKDTIESMDKLIKELGTRKNHLMIEEYFLFIFKKYVPAKAVIFLFKKRYKRSTIKFYAYGQNFLKFNGVSIVPKKYISHKYLYWFVSQFVLSISLFFIAAAFWFFQHPFIDTSYVLYYALFCLVAFGLIFFGLYDQLLSARLFYVDILEKEQESIK